MDSGPQKDGSAGISPLFFLLRSKKQFLVIKQARGVYILVMELPHFLFCSLGTGPAPLRWIKNGYQTQNKISCENDKLFELFQMTLDTCLVQKQKCSMAAVLQAEAVAPKDATPKCRWLRNQGSQALDPWCHVMPKKCGYLANA